MSRRRKACAHFEVSAWQPHVCRRCFVTKDCHQNVDNQQPERKTVAADGLSRAVDDSNLSRSDVDHIRKVDSAKGGFVSSKTEGIQTNSFTSASQSVVADGSRNANDGLKEIEVTSLVRAVAGGELQRRPSRTEADASEGGIESSTTIEQDQSIVKKLPSRNDQAEKTRKFRPSSSVYKKVDSNGKAAGTFIFSVDKTKQVSGLPVHMSAVVSSDSEMSDASSTNWTPSKGKLFWPAVLQQKQPTLCEGEHEQSLAEEKNSKQPLRQTDGQSSQSETTETVDSLLEQLRNVPQATRRHSKGSRVGSLKGEIRYTPQQQYRLARRHTTAEKHSSTDNLLRRTSLAKPSGLDEMQQTGKTNAEGDQVKGQQDSKAATVELNVDGRDSQTDIRMPGSPPPQQEKASAGRTGPASSIQQMTVERSAVEQYRTSVSIVPNHPIRKSERKNSFSSSSRVSTLDFVTTQLAFIAEAWSQEEVASDGLPQQPSLQDFRLVENMAAADWCDGTSGIPLWKQNSPSGQLPCEATFPVACVQSGLKQSDRIYCLRVGVNRQRGMEDAEQSYARFKTDYRVLERLSPHPNVLRVLAHFRDTIPPVLGEGGGQHGGNGGGIPHAIFVLSNHLPLLNARMYLRKCEELLSVEGYQRCIALLLFQLFDGLKHLHREGAIHCNLTQDNLLIVPTMHPGGGDRLVISSFGDSIYYSGPPAQFTLTPEQATQMVCQGKGWNRRCQPPDLRMSSMLPSDAVIDLQFCDIFRVGTLLYDMLGLESSVGKYVTKVESLLCSGTAPHEVDVAPPRVPLESCFSEPLHQLGAHLIHPNPQKCLDCAQALCVVGAMLWGPTLGHNGLLGLESGITAKMWLKRRRVELLAELAGAYSLPNGLQAGGFALADELHCRFLAQAHPDVLDECLSLLRKN